MNDTAANAAIFAPLWKRKWLILIVGLLVAAGTYAYYKGKTSVYQSSTQIYLGNGSEEQGLVAGGKKPFTPTAANATALINSALIREAVHKRLRKLHTPAARQALRGKVTAKAPEKSQFVGISTQAGSPRAAALLANTTAQAYIQRENESYLRSVETAIALTRRQLRRIEASLNTPAPVKGKTTKSPAQSTSETLQAASLTAKINQLESDLAITGVKQTGLARPNSAVLISPKPRKNAIFGFVIGLFLASVITYALTRFDRRLRSLTGIEAVFGAPILTALPRVRNPIVRREGFVAPSRHLNEPLRRLHTSLRLGEALGAGNHSSAPRSVLFVSADAADGKSTIAAGLALVARESGEQVALIEADFRRPVQAALLGANPQVGLFQAISGSLTLDEAMQPVQTGRAEALDDGAAPPGAVATMLGARRAGTLSVVLGQRGVANPPALLETPAMRAVLRSAAEEYDQVVVDAPSPLQVSDAMSLLSQVDGIVLVARAGHTRETSAHRLVQLLARTPSAPVLGVVVNDVSRSDAERYGFSDTRPQRSWAVKLIGG